MPLGPSTPEWATLRGALIDLSESSGGDLACVLDASGNLWCASHTIEPHQQSWAMETVRHASHEPHAPIARGVHLGRRISYADRPSYLRSFAGTYVLLVSLVEPIDELRLHRAVDAALPQIERLTLALPPTDGPHTHARVVSGKG